MPEFRHQASKAVYDYWMSLRDGRIPSYRDWDPIRVAKQMSWCTILERGGPAGYQYRFAGTAICGFYNEDITGHEVGRKMDGEARTFYFEQIEETLRRPCGLFFYTHARSDTGRDCVFETIALPLADDDGTGIRLIMHQVIVEEVTYGDPSANFSLPDVMEWVDLGAGVPSTSKP